ncbi:hypothetical protein GQ53DRAFT_641740 [Thozetella sp. PMI_491]|nr:hypothetical protein GQ53DRAFT_641740 [Thozetella sp. PMI_491]
MKLVPFTYTRPSYVGKRLTRQTWSSLGENGKILRQSGVLGSPAGVPDGLSFDKMLYGSTCSPMTVGNFMDYLMYIEHSAENLQFFLWYQDYVKRFNNANTSDLVLVPEWTTAMEDKVAARLQKEASKETREDLGSIGDIFKGTDFEKKRRDTFTTSGNPFDTPPLTPINGGDKNSISTFSTKPSAVCDHRALASEAFAAAGSTTPFTIQPYRDEINRIISTYIMDGAPRQLNLSDRDRKVVLHALSYTTHPSALRTTLLAVEHSLRRQSHPNFVRWSIFNGNQPRIAFARVLGYAGVAGAFTVALLLTLSGAGRGWRAFAAIGWVLGMWAAFASYRGMCICMYTFSRHYRHIRPWEFFENVEYQGDMESSSSATRYKKSFDSFGSSNSFEEEPWVIRYEKRNLMRKIFDRETWIQDPTLRKIQDVMFLQAMLFGLLTGGAFTLIFIFLRPVRLF